MANGSYSSMYIYVFWFGQAAVKKLKLNTSRGEQVTLLDMLLKAFSFVLYSHNLIGM
jgi:hypothetical protein